MIYRRYNTRKASKTVVDVDVAIVSFSFAMETIHVLRTYNKVPRHFSSTGSDAIRICVISSRAIDAIKQFLVILSIFIVIQRFQMTREASVQWTNKCVGRLVHLNGIMVLNATKMIKSATLAVFAFLCIKIIYILACKTYMLVCDKRNQIKRCN